MICDLGHNPTVHLVLQGAAENDYIATFPSFWGLDSQFMTGSLGGRGLSK